MRWHHWRSPVYLSVAALLWSLVAGILLYALPLATSVSSSSAGDTQTSHIRIFSGSLAEAWMLFVPALLCALATWSTIVQRRRPLLAATAVLVLFALLTALSIGVAYVPAVVLLIRCAFVTSKQGVSSEKPVTGPS